MRLEGYRVRVKKIKQGITSRRDNANQIPEVGASLGWVRADRCDLTKQRRLAERERK